jgi:hypothetical protein
MFYFVISITYFILFVLSRNVILGFYFGFNLVFMGLIPWLEGGLGYTYWGLPELDQAVTVFVDLIILLQSFLVFKLANYRASITLVLPRAKHIWFLCVLQCVIGFYIIMRFDFNWFNLLFRAGEFQGNFSSQIDYLFVTFLRIFVFNLGIFIYFSNSRFGFLFFLLSVLILSPFSMTRALTGAIYLSIIFYALSLKFRSLLLPKMLILTSMAAFPLFDFFRQLGSGRSLLEFGQKSALLNGQFDSHQIIVNVITDHLFLWGNNLLGAFLFFVPRSLWESKPVSSGRYIADHYDLSLNNISAPFVAEMVIGFGFIGLFLHPFILSKMISMTRNISYRNSLLYFQMSGLSLMLFRGSLMTTFSFLFCIIFSWLFISTVTKIR